MICINCNKEILITAKFCPECGAKFDLNTNGNTLKKNELIYFFLMIPSLFLLPGLHRIYMRSYKSGLFMIGSSLFIIVKILNGVSFLPIPFNPFNFYQWFYDGNSLIIYRFVIFGVYIVQFYDLTNFYSLNNKLRPLHEASQSELYMR